MATHWAAALYRDLSISSVCTASKPDVIISITELTAVLLAQRLSGRDKTQL